MLCSRSAGRSLPLRAASRPQCAPSARPSPRNVESTKERWRGLLRTRGERPTCRDELGRQLGGRHSAARVHADRAHACESDRTRAVDRLRLQRLLAVDWEL